MIERDLTSIEAQLAALSPATVAGLASQALGGSCWTTASWRVTRIHLSYGSATGGIYRLAGTAEHQGQSREWSTILKIVVPLAGLTPEQNENQRHPIYWKREVLVYESGWLAQLPSGLRGPRCLGVEPQPDGSVWLWLEDVQDRYGDQWPLEQYGRAARALGRFNGAYLAGQPWPPYDWLNQTGAEPRGVIEAFGWVEELVRDPATWNHPRLRSAFPAPLIAGLPRLWDNRQRLFEALERLPRTICHQDAWRGNLFAPPGAAENDLVLIDWAYVGRSVLGGDLGDLAVAGYGIRPESLAPSELDAAVFEPYLEGLREAGWPAQRNPTRFAYITFAALKYGCLLIWLPNVLDESLRGPYPRMLGQSMEAHLRQQAVMLEHLLRLLDEALGLLEVI